MTDSQYYIAIDNFNTSDKNGSPIEISIGNEFILLEDLKNQNFRLKNLTDLNEVILPSNILENMSIPSKQKPSMMLRSQSAVKERICSINSFKKLNETPEKGQFSTFGHGSLSEKMSRSTFESNLSRTLPANITIKDIGPLELIKTEKVAVDNLAVMRKPVNDSKWSRIQENDHDVHVNINTGERYHETIDDQGRQYFYNESSRMSTWELPDNESDLEGSGNVEVAKAIKEVPEGGSDSSESDQSWHEDSDDNGDKKVESSTAVDHTQKPIDNTESQDVGSKFNIRHIKKEHISGPLFNKLIRTERSGSVEKTKISENGKPLPKKWGTFHMVLTGPELLFYKDLKALVAKPGMPQGKVELKLKIQNLHFSAKTGETNSKDPILQVEDTGAPGSNITYLLRFVFAEDLCAWKVALQCAKDWQDANMYSEGAFNADSGTADYQATDKQKISLMLKLFFPSRPAKETLEARGILKPESVFGSSLDILCEKEKNKVPEFVFRCILAIEARGLHHNGIYRISGNQAKIQKLRLAVDENKYQLNSESMELETLTGAFKCFFKELKEPLFDDEFCSKMMDILSHRKADKKQPYKDVNISAVKKLLHKLRPSHYETAKVLLGHLYKVSTLSSKNLMDVSNLSMVWGPNLYLVAGNASTSLAVIFMTHNQVIDFLISCYVDIFGKP